MLTGQWTPAPAEPRPSRLPPLQFILQVARACSPSMEIGPLSAPAMLMPVIAGCNEIHAARPGEEPDPAGPPCEDLRLFDPVCLTAPDGELRALTQCSPVWAGMRAPSIGPLLCPTRPATRSCRLAAVGREAQGALCAGGGARGALLAHRPRLYLLLLSAVR